MKNKENKFGLISSIYDVNLEDAIRYLCGLYSICEKYYTNHRKIHQLLIIYKLWCIKNIEEEDDRYDIWKIFEIKLNKNHKLSLNHYEWCNIYCASIFDNSYLENINKRIDDDLSNVAKIPNGFKIINEDEFSDKAKNLLTTIFRQFGGYEVNIIDNMLTEISTCFLKSSHIENKLSINKELKLFLQNEDAINKIKSNKIINFINNYYIKKENIYQFNYDKVFNEFEKKFTNMSYLEQKILLEDLGIIEKEEKNIELKNTENDNHTIKSKLLKILKR